MTEIPFNRGAIMPTRCISDGWDLIKNEYWLFLGISLLALLMMTCLVCINLFITGPLIAGIYYCLFKRMNGESVDLGMMFKGFDKFLPTMLLGLMVILPDIIFQIVFRAASLTAQLSQVVGRDGSFQSGDNAIQTLLTSGVFALLAFIYLAYLAIKIIVNISLTFTIPLVIEHDLTIPDAIKNSARAGWSNIGGLVLLFILEFLIGLAGVLALCIGYFFVIPIIYAANAIAYRQVFPAGSQFTSRRPPSPDSYGASYGRPNYRGM